MGARVCYGSRVGLLSTLLHEASARRPSEVVIETDQPVRVQLPGGATDIIGEAIQGTAMSDELSDLLTTEQQVELALGEMVKFDLVVGPYVWHLVGETAKEVISVRARPSAEFLEPGDSVQIPIEPDVDEDEVGGEPRTRRGATAPQEIDIDLKDFDDEPRHGPLRIAALKPALSVRGADAGDNKPAPMWPRQVATRPGPGPDPGRGRERDARPRRVGGLTLAPTQQLPLHAVQARADAGDLVAALTPGTLGLLLRPAEARRSGEADPIAALLAGLELTLLELTEDDLPGDANRRLPEIGAGGAIVLRVEDPSPWLGWLLRRVEEGHRVLVETAATTADGARRILLGVAAGPRAEAWLDAVRVIRASVEDGRWTLL